MVATELLPAYVAAGDQASGERLISELMSRTGLNEEPAIRFGVHWHIVEAAGAWGNSERALRHAADAFTIALKNEVADPRRLGNSYAQLLLNTGQPPAAREARRTLGLPDLEWENAPADVLAARQVLRARASRILGQPERAIQELEPVLGRGAQPTPPGTHGRAFAELGRAYSTLGREREAAHAIRQAIPLLAQGGLDDEAEAVQADLARVTAGGDFPQTSVTARTNIKEASSRRPPQPRQTRRGGPRRG
jgi:tetratricopeptide (TPR) repeat protein